MRRREFIGFFGCATVFSPIMAHAQQAPRRIGVLMLYGESDPQARIRANALEQSLQKLGWKTGANLRIDYRWAGDDNDRFRQLAADLVALKEDAIVAVSTPAVKALQRQVGIIPIVFTQVSDPVGQGIVANVARPGGTVTGFTNYDPAIAGKWLGLLKDAAPGITRVAIVFNPKTAPYAALYLQAIEAVAPSVAVKVIPMPLHHDSEIEKSFRTHASEPGGGLIVMTDAFTAVHRKRIVELAARFALPATYPYRYYVADGGLMSYGIDQVEQIRGAATYVDRILRGERAGDLPVQTPTKFRLVINFKSAKSFGPVVRDSFLLRADEIIE
jgi:putative ABC transport system substrate-binding protein